MDSKTDFTKREAKIFAIGICTYRRVHLLEELLNDLSKQSSQPDYLIIVDGAPETTAVQDMIRGIDYLRDQSIIYIPTNHSCLSYHRYLNWLGARYYNCDILLYLDDDLRIPETDAVEKTIAPLFWENNNIVGVTANTDSGDSSKLEAAGALVDRELWSRSQTPALVRRLGAARDIAPGGLSPSGHRRPPPDRGRDYEEVEWLAGRVMAYRMGALTRKCFSPDMFAMDLLIGGLGEDTFLSRRVRANGRLILASCAKFQHPDDDLPKAYSPKAFNFGYATAYSRRLLNDNYRGFDPPHFSDRLALVKSYLGTALLNWWRALAAPKKHRFAYAWGYTLGAFRGLIQKPTAKNLTPHIDWWGDAEAALKNVIILQKGTDG